VSKVLIIFSTVGGGTELVVNTVTNQLTKNSHEVVSIRADLAKVDIIKQYDLVILASPTYNQGTLDDHFKRFAKDFSSQDFSNQKFAVIGLGDTKYYTEYLTESATILEELIKKTNGQIKIPSLRIGVSPIKVLNTLVVRWAEKLAISLV
jgi:flavodoxin